MFPAWEWGIMDILILNAVIKMVNLTMIRIFDDVQS